MRTGAPASLPEKKRVSTLYFHFLIDSSASVSLPDILLCLSRTETGLLSEMTQESTFRARKDNTWERRGSRTVCGSVSCRGDDTHTSLFKTE